MVNSFFVGLSQELNQGDIVDHIPWGLIEAPTTLCRPNDRKQPTGKAFYGSVGDLKKPPPWTHEPEFVHASSWSGLAMVLWHGCQLDKWKNHDGNDEQTDQSVKAFTAIAPVRSLECFQPAEQRSQVAAHQHYSLFPLPPVTVGTRQVPESYVDLRHIWPVRQAILTDRLTSISDSARSSLCEHLFTFFTRYRLDINPTCPSCGTEIQLISAAAPE